MNEKNLTPTDRFAVRLADYVTRHPWRVIAATLFAVALAASGARHLEFSNNYRDFFSPDNPDLVAFEEFQDTYTKNDNILFVLKPDAGEIFTAETLDAVEMLTREAWQIPYAIRVDSVTNFQHSWADGDDLTVEDLVRDPGSLTPEALAAKRQIALDEPLLRNLLLSPDASTTGINVTLQYPEESLLEVPEAVGVARELATQIEASYPGTEVALSGLSMLNNAFAEAGQQDATTLMPIMFGILVLFMIVSIRSAAGTISALLVVAFSSATALGLAGYAGIELTPISLTAPVIILTLAIADSVHILVSMKELMRDGRSKIEALRESLRINFLAVAITSVTTIVGFLSLNFSDSPPFWHLGNITAIGVAAALVIALVFMPALLTLLPMSVPRRKADRGDSAWLVRLADLVTTHHRPVLAVMGTIAVVLILLVPTVDLNDEFVKYFDHRVEFRGDAEFGMENLTGIYQIEYSVEAEAPGGISEPEYLHHLEGFTDWLNEQPEVLHVYSYTDIIQRLNKNLHGDDPAWHRTPENRELAAQYLLLYELSLPYGLDLNDRINIDKSATRVTATVGEMPTSEIRSLLTRSEEWLTANTPEPMWTKPTGAAVMFSYISQRNIESMLRGNALAIVLIALIMAMALRSWGLGALSIIPNAVPILMTFGLWGVLVGQVGMAAATVSATSLGIVVDDTVHFLSKYLRARREKRLDRPKAIRYAFQTVGRAMVVTTIILSAGFAILAASTFRINSQMGLLTSLAIVLALGVDFLLLPAILMIGHKGRQQDKENQPMKNFTKQLSKAAMTALLVVLALAGSVVAQTPADLSPEERGFELAARSDRSDRGFGDSVVEVTMTLRNKAGRETQRDLSIQTLEIPDEEVGDKSLIVFASPADIDGTALLSHAKILDPDDQWLYLPALKRVKRISSVNKSGPFVGSELAFEDLTSLELNKYTYKYVKSEPCGDLMCDVVERFPRYEHSGYTRQVTWMDQEVFQVRKVEFYERRGDLLKTLTFEDYREYDGGVWRSHLLRMTNHQTGKSTDLKYSDYEIGAGLDENHFVKGVLQRI